MGFLRTRTRSPLSLGLQNLGVVLGTEWTFRDCLLIDFNCMLFLLSGLGLTQYFSEALTWFWVPSSCFTCCQHSSVLFSSSSRSLSLDLCRGWKSNCSPSLGIPGVSGLDQRSPELGGWVLSAAGRARQGACRPRKEGRLLAESRGPDSPRALRVAAAVQAYCGVWREDSGLLSRPC